jgi:hypothetical protein
MPSHPGFSLPGCQLVHRAILIASLGLCKVPGVQAQTRPTVPKTLEGENARKVESLNQTIDQLKRAGMFAQAQEPAQQVLAICERALGPAHWQSGDARRRVQDLKTMAASPPSRSSVPGTSTPTWSSSPPARAG